MDFTRDEEIHVSEHPETVFLDLSSKQLAQLKQLFEHAKAEAQIGRPGIILAQPRDVSDPHSGAGRLKVGFLEHETAEAVCAVMELSNKLRKT